MTSEVLQMLVHTETGELIPAGDESLPELAEKAVDILDRHERDVWELGRIVSAARLRCEDPACGVAGQNPDARFRKWVSTNFVDTHGNTLLNARRLWEVFGQRQDEVAFIPQSGLYALAEPKCDDAREALLAELKASNLANKRDKIRVADVDEAIKRTVGHNHRALGTGENEWYTPDVYIEAAREVFGGLIALDPASSEIANQVVKAERFFSKDDNGLQRHWQAESIWMNPPYSQPEIRLFSEKLVAEWLAGHVGQAVALTHNYTDTAWFHTLANACDAICFTRGRIRFVNPEGKKAAPTQGQAFFYFGPAVERFQRIFGEFGLTVRVLREKAA